MKKIKFTKEEKAQHRAEDKAWRDMIRRATAKGALVQLTDWQTKTQDNDI